MSAGTPLDPARFADLLVGYCLDVKEGEEVLVRATTLAEPLLLEIQRAVLERDAWPLLRVELPGSTAAHYEHARDVHLDGFAEVSYAEAKKAHCQIAIQAPENTRALVGIDPERLARAARARKPVRDQIMKKRWCTTLWPTQANAQQAGMNLGAFQAFVARALFLDQPDPVRSWGELRAFQAGLVERLECAKELRIQKSGTDLRLGVGGRTWVNSDGRRNMPSGEVFTGPHERSATGRIQFDVPSSPAGVEVSGVTPSFATARSSQGRPSAATHICSGRWPPTTARAGSARSGSARTSASSSRSGRFSSTKRSAARCTWRSGVRTPKRAGGTSPPCTGT
ncbi:MAG: aminopeptidase [Solirubrobacteraceae bacterium]|nr:aminopeptidase [Solirubrobacteraceae bacterium]